MIYNKIEINITNYNNISITSGVSMTENAILINTKETHKETTVFLLKKNLQLVMDKYSNRI